LTPANLATNNTNWDNQRLVVRQGNLTFLGNAAQSPVALEGVELPSQGLMHLKKDFNLRQVIRNVDIPTVD
jgi:hypothetical protein